VIKGAGLFDENDFMSGTLEVGNGTDKIVVPMTKAILTGAVNVDPNSTEAYTAGSILLEATFTTEASTVVKTRILGDYDIFGYRETRLSRNELLNMNNYLGLLVKQGSNSVESHYLSNGVNNAIKFADNFLTDTDLATDADQAIHDELFRNDPLQLLEEAGGGINNATTPSSVTSAFNVGWGIWSGGADIIDATGGSSAFITGEDIYWLSAEREGIADLTGEWTNSNVIGFEGTGSDGAMTSMDMSFDMNFGTGAITNGLFNATVNNGSTDNNWQTGFSGSANGPTALINGFTDTRFGPNVNAVDNDPVTGLNALFQGIFTGNGANQGFATGFSLKGSIDGGSTFHDLTVVGVLGTRTEINPPP